VTAKKLRNASSDMIYWSKKYNYSS
jgi:hypothetical protein